jgi:hypothetical protein
VIILVNLTFCGAEVRKDLFTYTDNSTEERSSDAHLVEALTYALLLASLSNDQLALLPPIPLANADGQPHTPRKILSILTSNMESLGLHTPNRYKIDSDAPQLTFDGGFAETARWSLCALKNLTRPDKLSPSCLPSASNGNTGGDSVAARALLENGVVPLLLRIVRVDRGVNTLKQDPREVGGGSSDTKVPRWSLNSAQDAALYTLLHLAGVPEIRGTLREECGCVSELVKIVEIGNSCESTDTALGLQSVKAVSQLMI